MADWLQWLKTTSMIGNQQKVGAKPGSEAGRKTAARLWAPVLLLAVVVLFYWKLTLSNQYTWLESPDLAYQVLPWYQFQSVEWHQHRFPLWDPYEWGGQSLIGQAQPGVAYPLNWLLFLMPLRHGSIRQVYVHWYFVLIHYMGALFCYLLCRDLQRSRAAALLAGAAFSLSGWVGTNGWPQMLNGAVWAPLVFLFLLRAVRGERPVASAALAGSFLGVSFLSGHHQIPIFVTLASAGVWLYYLFSEGRLSRRWVAGAALFALFLFLVSALQTFPSYEYGKLSVRWVGSQNPVGWKDRVPYLVHSEYGLYPISVLGIIIPGIHHHSDPFAGLVIVSLAFLALAGQWRERMVRVLSAVALGGLIFSLASYSVFQGILYILVPMVEKARSPSMAIFIFNFAIAVLSAYGLDSYTNARKPEEKWSQRLIVGLVGLAAVLYVLLLIFSMAQFTKTLDHDQVALTALAALLLAGCLYGWRQERISSRAAYVLLFMLMLLELGRVSQFNWGHKEQVESLLKKLSQHADIVQFIRSRPGPVRLEVDDQEIPYNFGDWHGIDVFGGYLASLTSNINRIQAEYRARMLFGTNFYIGRQPLREGQVEVFTGASGLKVYANVEAFPRTWSVHEAVRIRQIPEIYAQLQKSGDELRRQTFLFDSPPQLESCGQPDRVRLLERGTSRVVIEADMQCKGMVVAGEAFFPGWQATVDGRPAPIYEAYTALRGVVVDAGRHRIEMRYRPKTVYWGAVCTGLGLLGAGLVAGLSSRAKH